MAKRRKTTKAKKEKTIVEKVFAERNLEGFVNPNDPANALPGQIVAETPRGTIRIEGEVTPEKLRMAQQFDAIFAASTEEIMDLAMYQPSEMVTDLFKRAKITSEEVALIKRGKPWDIFVLNGEYLLITPDKKLDTFRNYCFRLEQATLEQFRQANGWKKLFQELEANYREELRQKNTLKDAYNALLEDRKNPIGLMFQKVYGTLKGLIFKLLGENNG